jgi:phosphocarrier protein HPr
MPARISMRQSAGLVPRQRAPSGRIMNASSRRGIQECVKCANVVVRWDEGLHLRHAATLVKTAEKFRSKISLRSGARLADMRSILSIVALCATMGTALDIEANGDDEQEAAQAIEQIFVSPDAPGR